MLVVTCDKLKVVKLTAIRKIMLRNVVKRYLNSKK